MKAVLITLPTPLCFKMASIVSNPDDAPFDAVLDDLGVLQTGQRLPARFGGTPAGVAAGYRHPVTKVGQESRSIRCPLVTHRVPKGLQ
jgi:hypothetical protein